jgi:ApaG protein
MSETTPYRVQVTAVAEYVADQSRPQDDHFVFAYHITVLNIGSVRAQLLARHWVITDGNGKMQEVHGQGVVGEQPVLSPGQAFRYTSGCVLATPVGTMQGSYRMRADDGHEFEAEIPAFMLAVPKALH